MSGIRLTEGIDRGQPFQMTCDGEPVTAYPGESIAAALLAAGKRCTRVTADRSMPRGLYCGMGVCWECTMVVDGQPNVRICKTSAAAGMRIETQQGVGVGGTE